MVELREIRFPRHMYCILSLRPCHLPLKASNETVPAHSVSIEVYGGVARFPFDSTALLCSFDRTADWMLGTPAGHICHLRQNPICHQ